MWQPSCEGIGPVNEPSALWTASDPFVRTPATFERLRGVWSRRKWLAIIACVLPAAAVVTMVESLPNIYESTAMVIVDSHHFPDTIVKSSITAEVETRLRSINEDVLSRARLLALAEQFHLYPTLRQRLSETELAERMRQDIRLDIKSVERKTKTETATIAFTVSYRGRDPKVVADVTNTIATSYIDENKKRRERQARAAAAFLAGQLEETKTRLDALELRLISFKRRHIGELPEQIAPNMAALEQLRAQLRLNQANQIRAGERRAARAEELSEAQRGQRGESPLVKLKQELAQVRAYASESYPDVRRLKAAIAALENQANEAAPDARDLVDPGIAAKRDALRDAVAELRALKREEERLEDAIAGYERRVNNTPALEEQLRSLARDYDSTKELYRGLKTRYAEAQMGETMELRQSGEHFRLMDAATPTDRPISPNRVKLLMLGSALALAVSVGLVFLAERLDSSFHSVDNLRAFAAVRVVAIPSVVTAHDRRRRRWRMAVGTAAALVSIVVVITMSHVVADDNDQLSSAIARRF